jgi:putative transposase
MAGRLNVLRLQEEEGTTNMKYDPENTPSGHLHHRRSIRLQGYDYAQAGAYYVTIVTQGRELLFGEVADGEMRLNEYGRIVRHAWFDLPRHYSHLELGTFCIMPNHAHGIIILYEDGRGGSLLGKEPSQTQAVAGKVFPAINQETRPDGRKRHPLSEIVRAFKSFSAKRINVLRKTPGIPVWQRNYYEHIIRNEAEHNRIHLYIQSNPAAWMNDHENP